MNPKIAVLFLAVLAPFAMGAPAIGVDGAKQLINARLMKLRPAEATERNVLFQSVRPAGANGNVYKFQVSLLVRDYDPGYPRNRYYGRTCVGKIENAEFTILPDDAGEWSAQGVMTPPVRDCKPNVAEGATSVPLASLSGTPAPAGLPPSPGAAVAGLGKVNGLPMGEWACYRGGKTLVIGYGFKLNADGSYTDLDNKSRGSYKDTGKTILFHGGHLDGQTGTKTTPSEIILGPVGCAPWIH